MNSKVELILYAVSDRTEYAVFRMEKKGKWRFNAVIRENSMGESVYPIFFHQTKTLKQFQSRYHKKNWKAKDPISALCISKGGMGWIAAFMLVRVHKDYRKIVGDHVKHYVDFLRRIWKQPPGIDVPYESSVDLSPFELPEETYMALHMVEYWDFDFTVPYLSK